MRTSIKIVYQTIDGRWCETTVDEAQAQAPLIRNQAIVDRVDRMVACYDGRKKGGTLFTINYAHKVHKPVEYVTPTIKVTKEGKAWSKSNQ